MTVRTWLPDPSHCPEQMTPLTATLWFDAMGRGLHEAARELRAPFGGFVARTEQGWAYEGDLDPEWEPDKVVLEAAAVDLGRRWHEEIRPRCHDITEEIHRLRPERPDPAGAASVLDRLCELVDDQWRLHFLAVIPAQVCAELFFEAYKASRPDAGDLEPYRLLETVRNQSQDADDELRRIAVLATELDVDDIFREYPPDKVQERLALTRHGRLVLAAQDRYLLRFGGRSRWNELALAREAEAPSLTVEAIRLFLDGGDAPRGEPPAAPTRPRCRVSWLRCSLPRGRPTS